LISFVNANLVAPEFSVELFGCDTVGFVLISNCLLKQMVVFEGLKALCVLHILGLGRLIYVSIVEIDILLGSPCSA